MSPDTSTFYPGHVDDKKSIMDRLDPAGEHHQWIVDQLSSRMTASEKEMGKFYDRWRVNERKTQAYMSLPRYEQILKDMNNASKPPTPAIITFPYQYAVVATIVTYLTRVFCGRNPIFQLGISSSDSVELIRSMETMLQYQADQTKLIMRMFQFFLDGELYGLAVMRNTWMTKTAKRTMFEKATPAMRALGQGPGLIRTRKEKTIYAGAEVENIDPFMFFPDPTVPMVEVGTKGEFVGWREFVGKHLLQQWAKDGHVQNIDNIEDFSGKDSNWANLSNRNLLSGGDAHAGEVRNTRANQSVCMVDQIAISIIPDDWGVGEETYPVRYLFTLVNKNRIIMAEPMDVDHDSHPIIVAEPYTLGYSFGSPSLTDYTGQIQDFMSWLINSHIQNVRATLNDTLIVDPYRVEMADVKRPGPGKVIRLKSTALGQDVKTAIAQLPIQDVTRAHMADLQTFMRLGDTVSSISDNMRGVSNTGRRSATETRQSNEMGTSRLAAHAQLYSSQAISELARQMTLNTQQFMEDDIYLKVLGQEGVAEMRRISPQHLMGDFTFPAHDGTLPLDKIAALEQWKEMYQAIAADPEMRQTYSLPKIFEFMASDLGGAVNIQSFRLQRDPSQPQPGQPPMAPLNELPLPQGGPPPQAQPRTMPMMRMPRMKVAA